MSVWVSKAEVTQLTGWSSRHVERLVSDDKIASRPAKQTLRNGRQHREYAVHSLPPDAQRKFFESSLALAAQQRALPDGERGRSAEVNPISRGKVVGSALQRSANQPTAFCGDAQLQRGIFDSAPRLADPGRVILPPHLDQQARERFEAIQPLVEYGNGTRKFPIVLADRTIASLNDLAAWIAPQYNTTARTLWRWLKLYKKGFNALADKERCDKKKSRYFEDNPVLRLTAEKKYLSERLSIRMVHEALERECAARSIEAPSYTTVRTYLGSLPNVLKVISREGERQYHDRCEMYVLKSYRDKLANDIWVSDHMIHDVFVRNDDFFPDLPTNAAVRPWLTAIIDYRTRKCLGWTWCANPSSDSINSAMRMALLQFGKPAECFYVDNGKDFKSLGRVNTISPELSGALQRLEITSQYCQPRHPQSKHIERWFKTLHQRFDVLWRPFYSGTSPKDRPEECDAQLAEHKKLMKQGQSLNSPLPPASEFCAVAEHWIEKYNAQHHHTGEGMDGRTPDELFNEQYPIENRRLLAEGEIRALDILLRRRESRRVREGGCIFMANHRYEPVDPASQARMMLEIERDVIVACDPANMGEAIACDLDGHYLATLQASKLMEHGPTSRDEIRASIRQRRQVKRIMKDYVGGLIAASYARGEQSEIELLREGAGLAARPVRAQRSRGVTVMQLPAVAAAPVGYDEMVKHFYEED